MCVSAAGELELRLLRLALRSARAIMSLARILAFCALLWQPPHGFGLVRLAPWIQENAPAQGTSPAQPDQTKPDQTTPEKDQPQQSTPAPPSAEPAKSASPASDSAQPAPEKPAPKSPPPVKKSSKKKSASGPTKRVVRDGGTADPTVQLAPGVNQKQASGALQETNHLLEQTETNLKNLASRQLSANQQNVVSQIRQYVDQSRQAEGEGDPARAHTLAVKARLLSEDLLKH